MVSVISLWGVLVGTDVAAPILGVVVVAPMDVAAPILDAVVVALMVGVSILMWLVVPSTPVHIVIVTSSHVCNITMVIWYPIIMFREV